MAYLGPFKPENESCPCGLQRSETYTDAWIGFLFSKETEDRIGPHITHLVEWFGLFPITLYLIIAQHQLLHQMQNSVFTSHISSDLDGNECGSTFYFYSVQKRRR